VTSFFDRSDFNGALFYPRREATPPPRGASDLMIDVGGTEVHVRRHPGPKPSLLLFHGNGEVVADYDDAAQQFADAGVSLIVADYRGYGRSEGEPTLRTVIADARPIALAVHPTIVMGRSLGGAAAHELYARPTEGVAGFIFESAFSDVCALIRRRGLEPPPAFSAEEHAMFDPKAKLPLGRLPLLVLHGERDTLIVLSEARVTVDMAGSADKQLVTIPDRGHNDVSLADAYWDALANFVGRVT
jgi:pimeloyl-ACP methyl ester carboxylesterase